MVDVNGNRMDDKTRSIIASLGAAGLTAIEYFTPEPGFGKMLYGIPDEIIINPFKKFALNTVKGGVSESTEEMLQSIFGDVSKAVAQWYSNKYGTTEYNEKSVTEIVFDSLENGIQSFGEAFIPSMLVGVIPNAVTSFNPSYLTTYNDVRRFEVSQDEQGAVLERQELGTDSKIAKTRYINFKEEPVDYDFNLPSKGMEGKLPTVKVKLNAKTGKFTPIDDLNHNIAKFLYNNGLKAIGIDIVEDGDVTINADTVRSVAQISEE